LEVIVIQSLRFYVYTHMRNTTLMLRGGTRVRYFFDFFVRVQRSEQMATLAHYVFFNNFFKFRVLHKVVLHSKSGDIFDFFVRAIFNSKYFFLKNVRYEKNVVFEVFPGFFFTFL